MQLKAPPHTEELETEAVLIMFLYAVLVSLTLRNLEPKLCLQAERLVRLEAEQRCVEAVRRASHRDKSKCSSCGVPKPTKHDPA